MSWAEMTTKVMAIAALKRISRKPLPADHRDFREFKTVNRGPLIVLHKDGDVSKSDFNNPLWKPEWAEFELNPCDCSVCIALRTLNDMKVEYESVKT